MGHGQRRIAVGFVLGVGLGLCTLLALAEPPSTAPLRAPPAHPLDLPLDIPLESPLDAPPPVPLPVPDHHPGFPAAAPSPPVVCANGAATLSAAEVEGLLLRAASAVATPYTVAVVDRLGNPLGVFVKAGSTADPARTDRAVGLARTGAFFSNDQAPLSSRTVRFVSGIHFPPGVARTPNAALYGIENTNRGCRLDAPFVPGKEVPPATRLAGGPCRAGNTVGCGTGPVTGKAGPTDPDFRAVDPGGVPVFRGAALVGGIGVAGLPPASAEFAAVTAVADGFLPQVAPPGVVFIDGIRLPFVEQVTRPPGTSPEPAGPSLADGTLLAPLDGGACAPDGYLVRPRAGTRLTASQVDRIVRQSIAAAGRTRAVIRLPLGSRARMVIAVGDVDGTLLALYRMPDATVFSIDVAVAKARNVVWFSSPAGRADLHPNVPPGTAVTNRTISFGAQPLFPAGIDGSGPGPFFDLFRFDTANPCRQGSQPAGPNQNGVVFFPGSLPLYSGRDLVGGLGISGDGVEQDDYVSFLGAEGFRPPEDLWADRVFVDGVRLPFLKFPRNPEG
jgi:uncharacterized protein GlcG (DUF336 family)